MIPYGYFSTFFSPSYTWKADSSYPVLGAAYSGVKPMAGAGRLHTLDPGPLHCSTFQEYMWTERAGVALACVLAETLLGLL